MAKKVATKKPDALAAVAGAAAPVAQPHGDPFQAWTAEQHEQNIAAQIAVILKHEEENGYVTAAYWRLGRSIKFMRAFDFFPSDVSESEWLKQRNVNPTRKSRALSFSKIFDTAAEASATTVNAAIKMVKAARGVKDVPKLTQLRRKVRAVEKLRDELRTLLDELTAEERPSYGNLIDALVTDVDKLEAAIEAEEADEAAAA